MQTHGLPLATFPRGFAAHIRWPAMPAMPAMSVPTLGPCLLAAAGAMLLGSCDWCHGEVRITLAVCVGGASASAILLLAWERGPETMAYSSARAAIGALVAAAPLLGGM